MNDRMVFALGMGSDNQSTYRSERFISSGLADIIKRCLLNDVMTFEDMEEIIRAEYYKRLETEDPSIWWSKLMSKKSVVE